MMTAMYNGNRVGIHGEIGTDTLVENADGQRGFVATILLTDYQERESL